MKRHLMLKILPEDIFLLERNTALALKDLLFISNKFFIFEISDVILSISRTLLIF